MAKQDNKRLFIMLGFLGVMILYLILSKTVFAKKDKVKRPAVKRQLVLVLLSLNMYQIIDKR